MHVCSVEYNQHVLNISLRNSQTEWYNTGMSSVWMILYNKTYLTGISKKFLNNA